MKIKNIFKNLILILIFVNFSFAESFNDKLKSMGKLEKPEVKIGEEENNKSEINTTIDDTKTLSNNQTEKNDTNEKIDKITQDIKKEEMQKQIEAKRLENKLAKEKALKEKLKRENLEKERIKREKILKLNKLEENKTEEKEKLTPRMTYFKGLFELVKERRKGMNESLILPLSDPFIIDPKIIEAQKIEKMKKLGLLEDENQTQTNINLLGVFDNKANINGKWYKISEKIGGYTLIKVNKASVVVTKNNIPKTILLRNQNGIIFH